MTWKPKLLVSSRMFLYIILLRFSCNLMISWTVVWPLHLSIARRPKNLSLPKRTLRKCRHSLNEHPLQKLQSIQMQIISTFTSCSSNDRIQWSFKDMQSSNERSQLQVGGNFTPSKAPELVESGPCRSLVWDAWRVQEGKAWKNTNVLWCVTVVIRWWYSIFFRFDLFSYFWTIYDLGILLITEKNAKISFLMPTPLSEVFCSSGQAQGTLLDTSPAAVTLWRVWRTNFNMEQHIG